MLALSLVADRLGRRFGSITTATIMFLGGAAMTLSPPWGGLNTMFLVFTISYGIYGMHREFLPLPCGTQSFTLDGPHTIVIGGRQGKLCILLVERTVTPHGSACMFLYNRRK
jgi:hypothetical protein